MNVIKIPYTCILCGEHGEFKSIENDLGKILKDNGFPYKLSDFETLSYKTYACPNCGGSDRDRLYKIYIEKYGLPGGNKAKLLDFAPSIQLNGYLKSKTKNYRSADLFMDDVDDKVDITNMEIYKDNTFDFFVCSHILEHVDSDEKALSELYRVLKPGGRGILMTPLIDKPGVQDEDPKVTDVPERLRRFAQDDHVRLYEKEVFLERVKRAGFRIGVYGFWNLGLTDMLKNGINLKARLYVVEKR